VRWLERPTREKKGRSGEGRASGKRRGKKPAGEKRTWPSGGPRGERMEGRGPRGGNGPGKRESPRGEGERGSWVGLGSLGEGHWLLFLFPSFFPISFHTQTFKPFHLNSNNFEFKPTQIKPCTSMNAQASCLIINFNYLPYKITLNSR
jgi:hypothetical protein